MSGRECFKRWEYDIFHGTYRAVLRKSEEGYSVSCPACLAAGRREQLKTKPWPTSRSPFANMSKAAKELVSDRWETRDQSRYSVGFHSVEAGANGDVPDLTALYIKLKFANFRRSLFFDHHYRSISRN